MNLADMFSMTNMTASINKLPATYSAVGAMGLFQMRGITGTSVTVDERAGRLHLVAAIPRSEDPAPSKRGKRTRRTFTCSHLPDASVITPDEMDIQAFGSESVIGQQAIVINDHLSDLRANIEITKEYHMAGAIQGTVYDSDGSSVITNMHSEFGVSKRTANIAFSNDATDVRKAILDAKRHAESKLSGVAVRSWRALCGSDFFDALTAHPKVQKAYEAYQAAQERIGGDMRSGFTFAGVTFVEYNAQVGNIRFVPIDKCTFFAMGSGIFIGRNGSGNYNGVTGTLGQEFYSQAIEKHNKKGWDVEAQANPLYLNMFPEHTTEFTAT